MGSRKLARDFFVFKSLLQHQQSFVSPQVSSGGGWASRLQQVSPSSNANSIIRREFSVFSNKIHGDLQGTKPTGKQLHKLAGGVLLEAEARAKQVKVYESLFGNAKLHASSFSTEVSPTAVNIPKTMNLRPLSPHLSIYKPQPTSMSSIFHRIAFIVLATSILSSTFLYLGIGPILFHHEMVYNIFFYLSMLWPIIAMVNALALSYYVYVGIHHSKPLLGALVNKMRGHTLPSVSPVSKPAN